MTPDPLIEQSSTAAEPTRYDHRVCPDCIGNQRHAGGAGHCYRCGTLTVLVVGRKQMCTSCYNAAVGANRRP